MLRKIINTQQNAVLVLDLPKNLQGRRIEVIAFAVDDDIEINRKKPASTFFGSLSPLDAQDLRSYLEKSRDEWTDPFADR
jgi:hypothetical protein